MEFDIAKAEKDIAAIKAKIDAEKNRLDAMTPEQVEAEMLHTITCQVNHTDGCGWYYETWKCERGQWSEHADFLRRLRKVKAALPEGMTLEEAVKIYKTVGGR